MSTRSKIGKYRVSQAHGIPIARKIHQQCAALPLTIDPDGQPLVMLITSRTTRRWIIPKGWVEKDLSAAQMAAREALEEAGLVGTMDATPIGKYRYEKKVSRRKSITCEVSVYVMRDARQIDDWKEKNQRVTRWLDPALAASLVSDKELAAMIHLVVASGK